jgi:putative membrane protein
MLFISGIFGAIGCIIPGISGMVLVMLFGYYPLILKAINDLLLFDNILINISILFCFGIGLLLGAIITARSIIKLTKKWPNEVNFCVFGFVLGSIFYIILKIFEENITLSKLIIIVISKILSSLFMYFTIKLSKK